MVAEKEKLQKKYTKAIDALASLQEALSNMENVGNEAQCVRKNPEIVYKIYRDSLIQRFEYTFDVTWKHLSAYLQTEGRRLPVTTPKAVFRESFKLRILSEDDVRLALQMVEQRNLTTHGYDEALIEKIRQNIPAYYELLKNILEQTSI